MFTVITRKVSPSIEKCELTCIERHPIDVNTVIKQHDQYVELIRRQTNPATTNVIELPALPDFPDSMFVEDVAIVTDFCAVLTRPGVNSRQAEVSHMRSELSKLRRHVFEVTVPGTIDGGDTLVIGNHVFVGSSTRTNVDGFNQLANFLKPFGFSAVQLRVEKCMHLKCAVTALTPSVVLLDPTILAAEEFTTRGFAVVTIDPAEEGASNVLSYITPSPPSSCSDESGAPQNNKSGESSGDAPRQCSEHQQQEQQQQRVPATHRRVVTIAKSFPKTQKILEGWAEHYNTTQQAEIASIVSIQVDEIAKAEGALTCCSLLVYPEREQ